MSLRGELNQPEVVADARFHPSTAKRPEEMKYQLQKQTQRYSTMLNLEIWWTTKKTDY